MLFYNGRRGKITPLAIDGHQIEEVKSFRYLGITFTNRLSFSEHILVQNSKARSKIGYLFTKFNIRSLPFELAKKIFSRFSLSIILIILFSFSNSFSLTPEFFKTSCLLYSEIVICFVSFPVSKDKLFFIAFLSLFHYVYFSFCNSVMMTLFHFVFCLYQQLI